MFSSELLALVNILVSSFCNRSALNMSELLITFSYAQAAAKTNDTAGDGTTTATILSAAIIAEGMKIVQAGTNPVQLTRGIEKTVAALVKELKDLSTEVKDEDLVNVATVSAGGSEVVRPLTNFHGSTCHLLFLQSTNDKQTPKLFSGSTAWTAKLRKHLVYRHSFVLTD